MRIIFGIKEHVGPNRPQTHATTGSVKDWVPLKTVLSKIGNFGFIYDVRVEIDRR